MTDRSGYALESPDQDLLGAVQRRLFENEQANARFELAMRLSNIAIWDFDMPDGNIDNARMHAVNFWEPLGYDPKLGGMPKRVELWHPDDRERTKRALDAYLSTPSQGSKEYEIETRVRHRDGSYRWMLTRGVAERDAAGRATRFIGMSIDITELKHAQGALEESERRYRGTFENAPVGIVQTDFDTRILRVNQKYCEITGYSRDELIGKTAYEITHPDDLASTLEMAGRLTRNEIDGYAMEKRYLRKDGSPVWVEITLSLQQDSAGSALYVVGITQDISERKRLEDELREAKELAEAANRAKDEFLANVSHEIRTPMNAILGMTELVLDMPLGADQQQSLKTVRSAADSLLGLINDLLDFSKIEARKLDLDVTDFSLRSSSRKGSARLPRGLIARGSN